MITATDLLGARGRGDAPPGWPRAVVVVLRPDAAASPELLSAAKAAGGTVTVVLPLRIHGFALGMPNPGLMPTRREREAADTAITATVRALRRAGLSDVDGQIVVTRKAHKAIAGIVRRRGAGRVLFEHSNAGRLRRLIEGDLTRQVARRVSSATTVVAV
jgi:hypothetical protein